MPKRVWNAVLQQLAKEPEFPNFEPEDPAKSRDGLQHCSQCDGSLVYPVNWRSFDDTGHGVEWELTLRCPSCEFWSCSFHPHAEVEQFDAVLNRGSDAVVDLCERVTRENMQHDVELFTHALQAGHILPMDF
jgi:hypothetical protein